MVDANQVLEHLELNYPKMPRFIHNTELGIMIDEAPAVRDKPEGYKDGGSVKKKPAYNVDEMRYALTRNK